MSAPGALKTEREILSSFQELRSELDNLAARANNIAAELNEHDLVLKTLEPLDGSRKCYRLVSAADAKSLSSFTYSLYRDCTFPLWVMVPGKNYVLLRLEHGYHW